MKLNFLTFAFVMILAGPVPAQTPYSDPAFKESCTSIMVGKKATADGSVITAHTCDSYFRTWLNMVPAADHADTARQPIYKGAMHTKTVYDTRGLSFAGSIPQAAHTYAYLNTAYPSLNDRQLAIGETTFSGPDTLINKNGMFLIEELQKVALQRCDNARDAITLIGSLIKQYGYGDAGECITLADKNEVWHMEILGEGPGRIGGVWAAQRIPDDHVGISANISRISTIDFNDRKNFMYSENVKDVAKEFGLWDGKEPFKFWKAYANRKKPYSVREFWVLSQLAPGLNLNMEMDELPFSVKPEKKVTLAVLNELYRATYEGTQYDMTRNVKYVKRTVEKGKELVFDTLVSPVANPWLMGDMRNMLNYVAPGTIDFQRTVSVSWCAYSHITQLRDWLPDEVGGVSWFSFDNPAESPRIPIYAGVTRLPANFDNCGYREYRDDAAIWDYRRANRLATVGWGKTRDIVLENILSFEEKARLETPLIEQKAVELIKQGKKEEARTLLTHYTSDFAGATAKRWREMEGRFWSMFGNGF